MNRAKKLLTTVKEAFMATAEIKALYSINKCAEDYGCQPVGESAPCAGV